MEDQPDLQRINNNIKAVTFMLVVSNGDRVRFEVSLHSGKRKWVEIDELVNEEHMPMLIAFLKHQARILYRFGRKFPVLEEVRERFAVRLLLSFQNLRLATRESLTHSWFFVLTEINPSNDLRE